MNKEIQWVDASKRHPKKNKSVLVLVEVGEYTFKTCYCYYDKGAYWQRVWFTSTGKNKDDVVNEAKVTARQEGVVAWLDLNPVCHLADELLETIKKRA